MQNVINSLSSNLFGDEGILGAILNVFQNIGDTIAGLF